MNVFARYSKVGCRIEPRQINLRRKGFPSSSDARKDARVKNEKLVKPEENSEAGRPSCEATQINTRRTSLGSHREGIELEGSSPPADR